jgi:hypothetical protein
LLFLKQLIPAYALIIRQIRLLTAGDFFARTFGSTFLFYLVTLIIRRAVACIELASAHFRSECHARPEEFITHYFLDKF